ncbi:MAG: helix-turn-helix transcriptional regulator, partial [Clostridia bacterium]|nr:helix-turn-helix transcriptional regulator [Clostridia bacterium]
MNISEPIKARRRELGMTQEQLAQQLGVSGP